MGDGHPLFLLKFDDFFRFTLLSLFHSHFLDHAANERTHRGKYMKQHTS
jgi:hypothetical protein